MRVVPIQTMTIEGFRGIRSAKIPLHPRVTVFFGPNAAGKSTVLDALAMGLGALAARVPGVAGRTLRPADLRVPYVDREAVGEKAGVAGPFARVTVEAAGGLVWDVTHRRSAQDRRRTPPAAGTKALHTALDPLVLDALDAKPGAQTEPIPFVAAYGNERAGVEVPARERGFRKVIQRFSGLDESLRATTRFKTVFEWFRLMEDEERRERERRRDFGFRLPELEWVRRAVERAEIGCRSPRVETKPIRMLVDFVHDDGRPEQLDIAALSDGYRTHFALVVDVAWRMVQLNPSPDLDDPRRGTNSAAVVLIDEIDLHLDPPWQARVVRGLLAAFPNTQFVLTTHSEQVIGSVEAACVRKLRWDGGEIVVDGVPFAQGASGERILIDLMGAPERVSGPVTAELGEYAAKVSAGQGESDDAKALRVKLDAALPGDPALHGADLEMQRQAFVRKLAGPSG